jgi:hypothetical protein
MMAEERHLDLDQAEESSSIVSICQSGMALAEESEAIA